jgi:hypothetical protein
VILSVQHIPLNLSVPLTLKAKVGISIRAIIVAREGWTIHTKHKALTYLEYIRERYYSPLLCTSRKVNKNYDKQSILRKWTLGLKKKLHPNHVFIVYCYMVIVLNDYLVHSC